jgi:serine-type D-Ala-D-Ala carboxypeptidase/endopeptidase
VDGHCERRWRNADRHLVAGYSGAIGVRARYLCASGQLSAVDGIWLGTVQGPQPLRIQIVVRSGSQGEFICAADSIDLNAFNLACINPKFDNADFSLEIPVVQGHWKGRLSADGRTLTGTWTQAIDANGTQSREVALNLARQDTRIQAASRAAVTFERAIAPVEAAQLEAVLCQDLNRTLAAGVLAQGKGIGVTVGVIT